MELAIGFGAGAACFVIGFMVGHFGKGSGPKKESGPRSCCRGGGRDDSPPAPPDGGEGRVPDFVPEWLQRWAKARVTS